MTSKVMITNDSTSNGDLVVQRPGAPTEILLPGQDTTFWVSTSGAIFITETWPTKKAPDTSHLVSPPADSAQ